MSVTEISQGMLSGVMGAFYDLPFSEDYLHYRNSTYRHVSFLINNTCTRYMYLCALYNTSPTRKIYQSERITHVLGRGIEEYVRSVLISTFGYANSYGKWVCACGRLSHTGVMDKYYQRIRCGFCRRPLSKYEEVVLVDEEYKIVARPDFIFIRDGQYVVVEIKSIKWELFDALRAPYGNHILQGGSYWRLLNKMMPEGSVHPSFIVLYVRKEQKRGSPYKDFVINAQGEVMRRVQVLLDNSMSVLDAVKSGVAPKRKCLTSYCSAAKACPFVTECFSMEETNEG